MGRVTREQSCDTPPRRKRFAGPLDRALDSFPSLAWQLYCPKDWCVTTRAVSHGNTSSAKCWFCLCCHSLASLLEVSGRSQATSLSLSGRHTLDLLLQVGSAGHAPRLVPTLTGNAQEASQPEHNWHRNSQELLFRWPTSAGQVGAEPLRVLSAASRCDLDFLIFPSCALFLHHSHQTPTFPGPWFLPAAQFHSPTEDPCCSQWPDPLPWLPSYTLNLASNSPALALSQPYVLSLKDSVYGKKTQLWGRRDPSRKI